MAVAIKAADKGGKGVRSTALDQFVTSTVRALPWLLLKATDVLQWQARAKLARVARLQQQTIWLDRTTCQLLDLARRFDKADATAPARRDTINVDWR